jgi:hypothetical protein
VGAFLSIQKCRPPQGRSLALVREQVEPQVLVLELVLVLALVLVVVQERVFPPSRKCTRTTLSNSMNAMCQRRHRWKL